MKFSDDDICRGCIFEDGEYNSQCKTKLMQIENECPCVECLLKCMCIDTCPAYNKLLDKIMKSWGL